MKKILIIEDHPIYRDGLAVLVAQLFAEAQVEQAGDAAMALEQLAQDDTFDLVLLDLKMPGLDASTALAVLCRRHPAVPVVVVSADDDAATIRACMDAGASGYIPKSARREILSAALAIVADGGLYLPPALHPAPATAPRTTASPLTVREREVLQGVCAGEPNKTIARRLGISEATVRAHLGAVFRALGVSNRTQAALSARRLGLSDATSGPSHSDA